jgi:hypothetical protein
MIKKLKIYFEVMQNMGFDYVKFRTGYELKRKTGLLKGKFPVNPNTRKFISLEEWKNLGINFFFDAKEDIKLEKNANSALKEYYDKFQEGHLLYFNSKYINIGKGYNWITNPENNFQYDVSRHWTEVEDLNSEAGDIKFVWEKSRFSYLHNLIRYDYHFNNDCSELIFEEIDSWIEHNPINQGPNYKCSQEISLRIMNWSFALYYYKNSKALNEERFERILHNIYWQLHHVRNNINFSRKAVRNNHAITETLMLYLAGILFPFFPESKKWSSKGKAWFEEEILYQIYEDGTFLQYAHNYHRVVIQLMTYGFILAKLNGETFAEEVYEKAKLSLNYLYQCQIKESGRLPHYGNNDGALFFKFNDAHFRDYRPQLNTLHYFFNGNSYSESAESSEEIFWFCNKLKRKGQRFISLKKEPTSSFDDSGCYLINKSDYLAFIKCGNHKHRPTHADNLHFDLWHKGENVLRDAGTYKYNTDPELVKFFNGTAGHNTIQLGDFDQMKKGPRFIWLNWSSINFANLSVEGNEILFEGEANVYKHIDDGIVHNRKICFREQENKWIIEDYLKHQTNFPIKQIWNLHPSFTSNFTLEAIDANGCELNIKTKESFYADLYGQKETSKAFVFETNTKRIKTVIKLK